MFKVPTVIIVGAGASFDFGYPLGPKLLTNIANGINDAKKIYRSGRDYWPTVASDWDYLTHQYLIAYENASTFLGCTPTELEEFAETALSRTIDSVDRFLRDHPSLQQIGKYFIAQEILQKSYLMHGGQISPNNFQSGTVGWIGKLINEMREGANKNDDLKANKVTLVTFNYDLTLELALDAQFDKTELHRGADWRDCVEIIHVYGQVNPPLSRFNRQGFLDDIKNSAKSIKIIGDVSSSPSLDAHRAKIVAKISEAERVISVGFSFDQANVELLGLIDNDVGPNMVVLNYDGNYGVRRTLSELNVKTGNIFAPEVLGKNMTITEAIGYGLLSPPILKNSEPTIRVFG